MKTPIITRLMALVGVISVVTITPAATYTFYSPNNTPDAKIPNDPGGPGTVIGDYSLQLSFPVTGLDNDIASVKLTLNNFQGSEMDLTEGRLFSPQSDALLGLGWGPYLPFGGTYIFMDGAPALDDSYVAGGTVSSAEDSFATKFSGLSSLQANGTWYFGISQFLDDGSFSLDSVALELTTIPEPSALALLGITGGAILVFRRRYKSH